MTICLPTLANKWDVSLARLIDRNRSNTPNVPLANEDTSMMDALGKSALEHLSLQSALQEILDLEGQDVIETHLGLVEHTNTDETTDEGVTLEQPLGVFGIELEQFTSRTTDFGEG